MQLLPEMLSIFDAGFLVISSFFTSLLTAAAGIGGGVTLLAIMAQIMPVAAIVPVHGIVQLGSNVGRAGLMRSFVDRKLLLYFAGGSLVGAFVGGQLVVTLPVAYLQLTLAVFILYATWGPKLSGLSSVHSGLAIGGGLSTLLTMFVGATGPFVAAILKPFRLGRHAQVATMSACMVVQHSLKVLVFGLLGFSFAPYLPLMAVMIAVGFIGTIVGGKLLHKLSEHLFKILLNSLLTVLALRLLWIAAEPLLAG